MVQMGDFGLAPGGGWPMRIVRWGTGVPRFSWGRFVRTPARYGHAAVAVSGEREGKVEIVEATPQGVKRRWVPVTHFDWSAGGPLTPQMTLPVRQKISDVADSIVGQPYDWPNIAKFLVKWAWPSFAGHYEKDYADGQTICSELVVWAYREAGVTGFLPERAPGSIAPNDMAVFLGPYRPKTGS